jgi:hypothetical protein
LLGYKELRRVKTLKFEPKNFAIFAILAFFASIISGAVVPYIPNLGNPLLMQAVVFIFPLFVLWIIWINWGKKAEGAL